MKNEHLNEILRIANGTMRESNLYSVFLIQEWRYME